jgi:tetratricopeptide (TPR) repeat protein
LFTAIQAWFAAHESKEELLAYALSKGRFTLRADNGLAMPKSQSRKVRADAISVATSNDAPTFRAELERALEHFTDPAWLGEHSPLAAPYVLGDAALAQAVGEAGDMPRSRGAALQTQLLAAATQLQPRPETRYDPQRLLKLLFFEPNRTTNQTGLALQLDISPATFYRHRLQAIDELEQIFAAAVQPKVRAEMPAPVKQIGREQAFSRAQEALRNNKTVALTGPSGVGKTALGANLASAWQNNHEDKSSPVFWFTFRPGINDQLPSLVFAIGHFLYRHQAPALWLQLLANRGPLDLQVALGLAWEGLGDLAQRRMPLLCFDEVDVFSFSDSEPATRAPLRHFLEGLLRTPSTSVPTLLIGQHLLMEPDEHIGLTGLTQPDVHVLLHEAGIAATDAELARVCNLTDGNPLLLRLFLALRQPHETLAEALHQLPSTPSLALLLSRVLRRLSADERAVLMALSVFIGAAPEDAWREPAQQAALTHVLARNLAQRDANGGITLQPMLRTVLVAQLSAETLLQAHAWAAQVMAARGEYTTAAHHYVHAHQLELAVSLWFAHRQREIERGQAGRALALFAQVARDALDEPDQRLLVTLRSELRALTGEAELALEDLQALHWPAQDPLAPRALELQGDMQFRQSQPEAALANYQAALDSMAAQRHNAAVRLHTRRGYTFIQLRDLGSAWHEGLLARAEAELYQGEVQEERGDYAEAEAHYAHALHCTQQANHAELQALAHYQLGSLAMRLERVEEATTHLQNCMRHYEAIGNRVQLNRAKTNLGGMLIQAGQYAQAIPPVTEALQFFEAVRYSNMLALNAANLAEAWVHMGEIAQAEHRALQALQTEEEDVRPYALTALGWVRQMQGQMGEAERCFHEAVQTAQEIEDRWAEAPAHRALGGLLQAQGKRDEACAAFDLALQIYTALKLPKEIERTEILRNT